MPPLPEVAYRVLQIVNDAEFSTDELVGVVRTDPALTARILKLCNSSIYALPKEVTSVSDAIAYLGIRNLVKLVVVTCTASYYRNTDAGYFMRPGEIWRHSIACGIACQLIAEHTRFDDPAGAFTAGILHNVGKVALSQVVVHETDAVRETIADCNLDFLEVERLVVGMDHARASELVTERWYLPVDIRRAIVNHHNPEQVTLDSSLTAIVNVADILTLTAGIGTGIDGLNYPLCPEALNKLGVTQLDLDKIRVRLIDQVKQSEELINLR